VATGSESVVGSIGKLTVQTIRVSAFDEDMARFSGFILRLVLVTLAIVIGAHLIIQGDFSHFIELMIFAIALSVAVVPEALSVVITFAMSSGAHQLSKQKVVVKRLSAIEDLGGINVLCTDKTGTITENVMTVADVFGDRNQVIETASQLYASVCQKNEEITNPFTKAILDVLSESSRQTLQAVRDKARLPFDPIRKFESAHILDQNEEKLIVVGAPEAVMEKCVSIAMHAEIELWIENEGRNGRRVLAVAKKIMRSDVTDLRTEEQSLTFVGIISFVDPLKVTAKDAVAQAKDLGIRMIILTGDRPEVAAYIATSAGILSAGDRVITGAEFEKMDEFEQKTILQTCHVFARVTPEQKFTIIRLLREQNYRVGFLGEGMNDAPALKIAHVGLVVQNASDIARETADIVLLEPDLHVIIAGIKRGRMIFANTMKYIRITLASNLGNFYALAISSLFIKYLPMLPIQILLVNLLTDFPMIAVASDNVDAVELKKPVVYDTRSVALMTSYYGIISTVFDLLTFWLFLPFGQFVLQTAWFIESVVTELVAIISLRTTLPFYRAIRPGKILSILAVVAVIVAFSVPYFAFSRQALHFVAITPFQVMMVVILILFYFISTEYAKRIYPLLFSKK
ncbi:MAG: HAD-IC family P-type ATPase, partial [Patescibacteria group bacterium]